MVVKIEKFNTRSQLIVTREIWTVSDMKFVDNVFITISACAVGGGGIAIRRIAYQVVKTVSVEHREWSPKFQRCFPQL